MIKIVLGGIAPLEEEEIKNTTRKDMKNSWKPSFQRIHAFFQAGIEELKRDLNPTKKKSDLN